MDNEMFIKFSLFSFCLFLSACVTINIYFPAAKVEKVADDMIDNVWTDKKSVNKLINEVWDKTKLPAIQKIKNRLKTRYKKLEAYYKMGAIGLTNNGLIILRDRKLIALKNRRQVDKWIEVENQDRLQLYIAITKKHSEWQQKIQLIFAKLWIEKAKNGWWYQDEKENWQRK